MVEAALPCTAIVHTNATPPAHTGHSSLGTEIVRKIMTKLVLEGLSPRQIAAQGMSPRSVDEVIAALIVRASPTTMSQECSAPTSTRGCSQAGASNTASMSSRTGTRSTASSLVLGPTLKLLRGEYGNAYQQAVSR